MSVIGKLFAIIGADTTQFDKKMAKTGKRMSKLGKNLTMKLTLPLLALAGAAVKAGADFEYAMTNAWAVTGEGEKALTAMTAKAREMGATTIFSARQAADAMYYMASAGWDSKKMADAIQPTLDLAAATQSDLAFATEAVISSMNQFQISTKDTGRVTNVFAAAIMNSQATLEKLKISMTFIGPLAHSLGYEIEETTATLMALYNAGYEASTAGTALRMALAKLTEGTGRTKEGLATLGLSLADVNPEMMSMEEILQKLKDAGAGASDVIKIFGVRSGPAMAALLSQGARKIAEFEEKITDTNAAAEMAEKQIRTFQGSIKLLISIINEACIQIFAVLGPIIKDLIDNKIRPAIEAFTKLTDKKKKMIMVIAGLTAVIPPLILLIGKLVTVLGVMGLKMMALLGPIGMVVAGFIGLKLKIFETGIALDKFSKKNMENMREKLREMNKALGRVVGFDELKEKALNSGEIIDKAWGKFCMRLQKNFGNLAKTWKQLLDGQIKGAEDLTSLYWTMIKEEEERVKKREEFDARLAKLAERDKREAEMKKEARITLKVAEEAYTGTIGDQEDAIKRINSVLAAGVTIVKDESGEKRRQYDLSVAYITKLNETKEALERKIKAKKDELEAEEEYTSYLESKGIKTIETKMKRVAELERILNKAHQEYKAGNLELKEYVRLIKEINDAIKDLRETLGLTPLPPMSMDLSGVIEALEGVDQQITYYGTKSWKQKVEEFAEDFQGAMGKVREYTDLIIPEIDELFGLMYQKQMVRIENEEKKQTDALESWYEREKTKLETTITNEEELVAALEALDEEKARKKDALQHKMDKERREVERKAAARAKAIALMEAIVYTASAVAEALPKIFKAVAVGVLGAAQIATIMSTPLPALKKGGIVEKHMVAELAEERPEVVAPLEKLVEIIKKAVIPIIPPPQIIIPQVATIPALASAGGLGRAMMAERGGFAGAGEAGARRLQTIHLHQTIRIGEDTIKKKITKIVMDEGELGNLTLPAKVIK